MGYHLEGALLEVCTCNVLCPCWIGEDPDFGTCDAILAYHYEKGEIDGVDVSGLTVAMAGHIPLRRLRRSRRPARSGGAPRRAAGLCSGFCVRDLDACV